MKPSCLGLVAKSNTGYFVGIFFGTVSSEIS